MEELPNLTAIVSPVVILVDCMAHGQVIHVTLLSLPFHHPQCPYLANCPTVNIHLPFAHFDPPNLLEKTQVTIQVVAHLKMASSINNYLRLALNM